MVCYIAKSWHVRASICFKCDTLCVWELSCVQCHSNTITYQCLTPDAQRHGVQVIVTTQRWTSGGRNLYMMLYGVIWTE